MLRSTLIYLSKAAWAREMVTKWEFARRAAARFIAGEKLEDAIRVVRQLNQKGINATLDHLGEHTTTPEKADQATQDILEILDAIHEAGVRSNVSIKLTQIGMALDEELCRENLMHVLEKSKAHDTAARLEVTGKLQKCPIFSIVGSHDADRRARWSSESVQPPSGRVALERRDGNGRLAEAMLKELLQGLFRHRRAHGCRFRGTFRRALPALTPA